MDPLAMILTALATGVASSVGQIASEEVPKAYTALKNLIVDKLSREDVMDRDLAEMVVDQYQADPEKNEEKLAKYLGKTNLSEGDVVVLQAKELLEFAEQDMGTEIDLGGIEIEKGSIVAGVNAVIGDTKIKGKVKSVTSRGIKISGSVNDSTLQTGNTDIDVSGDSEER